MIIQGTSGTFLTISLTCCQVIDKFRMLDRGNSFSSQSHRKWEWRNSCILQQNVLLSWDFQYSGHIKSFLTYCGLSRSQTHSVLKSICTLIFSMKSSSSYVSVKFSFLFQLWKIKLIYNSICSTDQPLDFVVFKSSAWLLSNKNRTTYLTLNFLLTTLENKARDENQF